MPSYTCKDCGSSFDLPQAIVDKYPGWSPSRCRDCRDGQPKKQSSGGSRKPTAPAESPTDGIFTDGSADPNPGDGGWGAVWVENGVVREERCGGEPDTTNNRMELKALIEGARMVPEGTAVTLWSDSNLAVQTVNEWAVGWEKRGWKRKTGPVQNLDLVKELYYLLQGRPELTVRWIKAHVGHEWNEHADQLANQGRMAG